MSGKSGAIGGSAASGTARLALWLVVSTLAYNIIEAVIALWSGTEAESIALFGFGLDSVIECAASVVLLWRLRVETAGADREAIETSERRVRRFVGWTFIALSVYVTVQAGRTLLLRAAPEKSVVGIVLAAASLLIMPLLAWAKIRAAVRIGSRALEAEAKETLACAILSLTLLVGLAANEWLGWWWADPVAALLMVPWLIKEGREGIRGEECGGDECAECGRQKDAGDGGERDAGDGGERGR